MNPTDFKELLHKYNSGICSEDEKLLIESWYNEFNSARPLALSDDQIENIMALKPPVLTVIHKRSVGRWISIAAAVLIIATSAVYFYLRQFPVVETEVGKVQQDVNPGTDKATLLLAGGERIILSDVKQGILKNEANTVVRKTAAGHVVYSAAENNTDAPVVFNTMLVPKGGQYHLTLNDGTQIWLNSNSSITFPTRFAGNERRVEVTGEAYFEVAHEASKPFKVLSKGQMIEVLGTHFNLNAYDDEPSVKTTLLQGSVKVTVSGKSEMLKPGEQAVFKDKSLTVNNPDLEVVMAWHDGDFVFKKQTVEEIMRTVSRWYDIDVDYQHYSPDNQTFTGVLSRSKSLSSVLQMMKSSTNTLKFRVDGKRIVVSN